VSSLIDLKQELQNYPSIDIENLEKSRPDLPDNIKSSVVLYNKALESMRSGSEDIAIIELKKAVSINPDFHEAINLLGLCYISTKEYGKAEEMFRRVISAENNAIKAMEYINFLEGKDTPEASGKNKAAFRKKKKSQDIRPSEMLQNRPKAASNKTDRKIEILKYAAVFLAGIVIMAIINPLIFDKSQDSISVSSSDEEIQAQIQNAVDAVKKEYEDKLNDLEEKSALLEDNLDKANHSIEYYKNQTNLFEIEKLASSKEYEKAADMLILLKPVAFQGAEKEKFDALFQDIMPKAAREAYNQGVKLFKQEKFQEAKDILSKAKIYGTGFTGVNMDGILYNLAKSYMELEDYTNAISTFNSVIEEFPGSSYANYSRNWIAFIESKQ